MRLRELKLEDAEEMLKWMHDNEVIGLLPTHFDQMTLEDCQNFIHASKSDRKRNIHWAVTNEQEEYLGTISLKNVDYVNKNAEYAIVLGKQAIGKGIAKEATTDILDYAFMQLELERVYLCVFKDNIRAKRFYEKYGFQFEGEFRSHMYGAYDNVLHDLQWYGILKKEFVQKAKERETIV